MEKLIYPLSLVLVGMIIHLCLYFGLYLFVESEQDEDVEKGENPQNVAKFEYIIDM